MGVRHAGISRGPLRVVHLRDPDGTVLELLDGPFSAVAEVLR